MTFATASISTNRFGSCRRSTCLRPLEHRDYYHAYGEPLADRFFFEIVQRNAYDGYGAVNAPARMASQEQGSRAGGARL